MVIQIPEDMKALMDRREAIEEEVEGLTSFLNSPGMPGVSGKLVDDEGFPRADIDIYRVRQARHRLCVLNTDYSGLMKEIEEKLFAIHAANRPPPSSSSSSSPPSSQKDSGVVGGVKRSTLHAISANIGLYMWKAYVSSSLSLSSSSSLSITSPASMSSSSPSSSSPSSSLSSTPSSQSSSTPSSPASSLPLRWCTACPIIALVDEVSNGSPAFSAGLKVGDLILRFGGLFLRPVARDLPSLINGDVSAHDSDEAPCHSDDVHPSTNTNSHPLVGYGDEEEEKNMKEVVAYALAEGCSSKGDIFQKLPSEVKKKEGKTLEIEVLRDWPSTSSVSSSSASSVSPASEGKIVSIRLIPKAWEGRGMMGCHLKPYHSA